MQQIEHLQQRKMTFKNIPYAEKTLKQTNYYRLSGYWHYFKKENSEEFQEDITFEHILSLKQFDDNLRKHLLQGLQKIEISFKTIFAHYLSINCGNTHPHLDNTIFLDKDKYKQQYQHLGKSIKRNEREEYIKHFADKYEEEMPPIWACVELMTFGEIIQWYDNLQLRYQKLISQQYNLGAKVLGSFMLNLSIARNKCTHYHRIWKKDTFTLAVKYEKIKNDHELKEHLLPSSKKPYNTIVLIDYFLRQQDIQHDWLQALNQLLKDFPCIDKYQDLGWKK